MPLPKMQTVTHTSKQYWNLPEGQRAELIDGHLYAMAPPGRIHQKLEGELYYIIKDYIKSNNGSCDIYPAPFAVNLDAEDKNWVEPDISVICDPDKLTDRGCEGAPDWIIEIISPSSRRIRKRFLTESSPMIRRQLLTENSRRKRKRLLRTNPDGNRRFPPIWRWPPWKS